MGDIHSDTSSYFERMPELVKGADLSSAGFGRVGSNPTSFTLFENIVFSNLSYRETLCCSERILNTMSRFV